MKYIWYDGECGGADINTVNPKPVAPKIVTITTPIKSPTALSAEVQAAMATEVETSVKNALAAELGEAANDFTVKTVVEAVSRRRLQDAEVYEYNIITTITAKLSGNSRASPSVPAAAITA